MKYFRFSSFIFLIVFFVCNTISSQNIESIDSLLYLFDNSTGEKHYNAGNKLWSVTTDETVFFDYQPDISDSIPVEEFDMAVLFSVERWMTSCSYFTEALPVIDRVLYLSEHLSNDDIYATSLCDKAYCLYKKTEYTQSIDVSQQAVYFSEQHENWLQYSRAYLYMSLVNYGLRNYDEAVVLIESAIQANDKIGNNIQTHNTYGVACELYCGAGQLQRAIKYGKLAVDAARAMDYLPGVANHLTQLSYAYDRNGDYQLGLDAANEAIRIVKTIDPLDRNQLAISLEFKGWNLIDMNRNAEAVEALREAIYWESEVGNAQAVCYDYRTLYEALEPIDAREALAALKRYTVMVDSLHFLQLKELTTKANAELHNDELQQENQHRQEMMRYIIYASIAVGVLLLVIILSLLYAFNQKRRTAEALRMLAEARESFFTNVTHEFRTPLTVILGFGRELRDGTVAENRLREAGDMIVRQGERLLSLVNQLLDISKIKSNIVNTPAEYGDLSSFVNMIVESLREVARQKNISIDYNTDDNGIKTGYIPDFIEKISSNLINNAIKFTPDGGHIYVELHRMGDVLELKVRDNGCGISSEDLPHIFETFYTARYKEGTGSGVGLALVHQIVEAMHGTIDVESEENQGSTFTVRWKVSAPVTTVMSIKPDRRTNQVKYISPLHSDSHNVSILVVEDNKDVSRYIGTLLEDRYDVFYAADGLQGLALARDIMPDIIITDLMMPKMDGLELCKAIRADINTDHIPIIVVTAKASEEDKIRGLKAGADTYLIKPFNSEELLVCVSNLIKQRDAFRRKYRLHAGDFADDTDISLVSSVEQSKQFMDNLQAAVIKLLPDNCNAETLAQEMFMSLRSLQRKMLVVAGTTPKKYIMDVRITLAKKMIDEQPSRTLEDIATACGFHDASHLVRNYRNTFGSNPRKH